MSERLVHKLGRAATRVLLAPSVRRFALARRLYLHLYLLGKTLAEPRERRFFQEHVQPGMVVLDIGANVGFYSLLLGDLVGPAGRVYAFEPDPLSFGLLAPRAEASRHGNVSAAQVALGDREGRLTLYCSRTNRADNRVHASHETPVEEVEVTLTTLDAFLTGKGVERIDAVKMDVQGAEVAVLAGARETLRRTRPLWMLIELSPDHLRGAGSSPEAFWEILEDLGYEPWGLDGADGQPFLIADRAAFAQDLGAGYTDVWAKRRSRVASRPLRAASRRP